MLAQCRIAVISLALFTVLTGIVYPAFVTAIAQAAFPHQANGSLILQNGKPWLELIGQPSTIRVLLGAPLDDRPFPDTAAHRRGPI